MFLCLHFHNYVDISQLAFQGRPVLSLRSIYPSPQAFSPQPGHGARCWGAVGKTAGLAPLCLRPRLCCLQCPGCLTKCLARKTALNPASPGLTHPPLSGQRETPRDPFREGEGTSICWVPTAARCWHCGYLFNPFRSVSASPC